MEKKGIEKRLIKKWRPISLIDMDTKIVSKTRVIRLEPILPGLIHSSQNECVKDWSILDAIRSIDDIMEYTRYRKCRAFLWLLILKNRSTL